MDTNSVPWVWMGYWRPDREQWWNPSSSPSTHTCIYLDNRQAHSTECEPSVAVSNADTKKYFVCESFQTNEYTGILGFNYHFPHDKKKITEI